MKAKALLASVSYDSWATSHIYGLHLDYASSLIGQEEKTWEELRKCAVDGKSWGELYVDIGFITDGGKVLSFEARRVIPYNVDKEVTKSEKLMVAREYADAIHKAKISIFYELMMKLTIPSRLPGYGKRKYTFCDLYSYGHHSGRYPWNDPGYIEPRRVHKGGK